LAYKNFIPFFDPPCMFRGEFLRSIVDVSPVKRFASWTLIRLLPGRYAN